MNYKIDVLPEFEKELKRLGKRYKSIRQDYARLLDELHANPTADADLGGGVHKVRMAIAAKNRGKSHGARVITYVFALDESNGRITLLTVYDKAERESIPAARVAELLSLAKARAGVTD